MAYTSRPDHYLDPPNWNQQHAHQIQQLVQHQAGRGEPRPLLQAAPPPRVDGDALRPGSTADRTRLAKIPTPEHALKCPRCDSTNTKFCYFNNYSLAQPRHFCKTCKRYWTRGGALRNVPVGGGCRRNKRSKSKPSSIDAKSGAGSVAGTGVGSGGAIDSSLLPTSQMPLLTSLHPFPDYGEPNIGLSYGGIQPMYPVDYSCGTNAGVVGLEQWRPLQQFPYFIGLDAAAPPMLSMGMYPFSAESAGTGAAAATPPIPSQVQGKMTCAGLATQLSSVKMEANNAQPLNLPRQYLAMANDHYWNGGGGGGDGGTAAGSLIGSGVSSAGPVWTDLSAISSTSTGSFL